MASYYFKCTVTCTSINDKTVTYTTYPSPQSTLPGSISVTISSSWMSSNLGDYLDTSGTSTFNFRNVDNTANIATYSGYTLKYWRSVSYTQVTIPCVSTGDTVYEGGRLYHIYNGTAPGLGSWGSYYFDPRPSVTSPSPTYTGHHGGYWYYKPFSTEFIYSFGSTAYANSTYNNYYYQRGWAENTYNVAYNSSTTRLCTNLPQSNNGVSYSTELTMPGATAPTGYTFTGWSDSDNGSLKYTYNIKYSNINGVATSSSGSSTNLYTCVRANTYAVAFNGNNSTSGTMQNMSRTYNDGGSLTANAFSRTGYTYVGWNTNSSGSGTSYANQYTGNITSTDNTTVTLYAQWTANTYTVTLDPNGGTPGTASITATYDSAMPSGKTAPTRTGYIFSGYYDATSNGTKYYNSNMTSAKAWDKPNNATLYAIWTPITYYVSFNSNNGVGTMSQMTMSYGNTYTLTSNLFTKQNYKFTGWKDASGNSYTDGASVSNLTTVNGTTIILYAQWELDKSLVYAGGTFVAIQDLYVYADGWHKATDVYGYKNGWHKTKY